jgi:hypothetical protein
MKKLVGVIVLCLVAVGAYEWYTTCHGFNSCKNPVCERNCG